MVHISFLKIEGRCTDRVDIALFSNFLHRRVCIIFFLWERYILACNILLLHSSSLGSASLFLASKDSLASVRDPKPRAAQRALIQTKVTAHSHAGQRRGRKELLKTRVWLRNARVASRPSSERIVYSSPSEQLCPLPFCCHLWLLSVHCSSR
jgi:hypothetical protein